MEQIASVWLQHKYAGKTTLCIQISVPFTTPHISQSLQLVTEILYTSQSHHAEDDVQIKSAISCTLMNDKLDIGSVA